MAVAGYDERAQASPCANNIIAGDGAAGTTVKSFVECTQAVVNVCLGALWVINGTAIVGVGGADVGESETAVSVGHLWHYEQRSLVAWYRDDNCNIVLYELPRHGDVDALGRANGY